jgi:hypothetical protein
MVGQPIESLDRTVVGDVAIFTLDRNLTSMATRSFDQAPTEAPARRLRWPCSHSGSSPPTRTIDTPVRIAANAIQVTRTGGWAVRIPRRRIGAIVADLYRFYD